MISEVRIVMRRTTQATPFFTVYAFALKNTNFPIRIPLLRQRKREKKRKKEVESLSRYLNFNILEGMRILSEVPRVISKNLLLENVSGLSLNSFQTVAIPNASE